MKNKSLLFSLGLIILATAFTPSKVLGVGSAGFRNEVPDAEALGKGSAFVAQADNPSAVYYNPAGLTQLKERYVSLGYVLELPQNSFKPLSGDEVEMQGQYFLIPNFYLVDNFGFKDFRFGLGVTAPYGLGTDWSHDSFSRLVATESDLEIMDLNPTVAYRVNDKFSVGAGINYSVSHISKHKRLATTLSNDGEFQIKGRDDGWGYNLGLLYKHSDKHSIGLSYRSEIELTYRGFVSLDNLNALYTVVFGGSTYNTDIKSELSLPQTLAVGYAYRPNNKWTFEADVEWADWSCVEQDKVDFQSETDATRLTVLNSGNPASKDWNDVFSYGFGAEYKATDKLALRVGYLFEDNPIPSANFDTALPDSDRHGLTLGIGYTLKSVKIDASYMALFFKDRDVTNDVRTADPDIDGKYEAFTNIFGISFTYKY